MYHVTMNCRLALAKRAAVYFSITYSIHVVVLCFLLAIYAPVTSKPLGDPGEGGGMGNEIGPNSGTALRTNGLLNPLTGQPNYWMNLLTLNSKTGFDVTVDLHYGQNISSEAQRDNTVAPTGWCGLGWHLGYSTIWAALQGTLGDHDDNYYYQFSNGVVSEIVRTEDGRWRIKGAPFWKVERHTEDLTPDDDDYDDVTVNGWTITKADGSIFKYGMHSNATRNVWGWYRDGNTIALEGPSGVPGIKFNYQWDLRYATGPIGSVVYFTYEKFEEEKDHGTYTKESYVKSISLDNGDKIYFDTSPKRVEEGPETAPPDNVFNVDAVTRYLSSIRYVESRNETEREIERIDFVYTGISGKPDPLYGGVKGREKRLLLGITSTHSLGMLNRIFQYRRDAFFEGYLSRIHMPLVGKTIKYTYAYQSVFAKNGDKNVEYRTPVVSKTEIYDGVAGEVVSYTTYSYSTDPQLQGYIPTTNMAYWGVVTANSGEGNVVSVYEVDSESNLFGALQAVKYYAAGTNEFVSMREKTYHSIKFEPFTEGENDDSEKEPWYYTMVVRTSSLQDGVETESGLPFCTNQTEGIPAFVNKDNGLVSLSYSVNHDHTGLMRQTGFAYNYYAFMGPEHNAYQVSQVASTKFLKVPGYTGNCAPPDARVVKASFTTWGREAGGVSTLLPVETYVWVSDMDSDGNPVDEFHSFKKNDPTANGWRFTGRVTDYNFIGTAIGNVNAAGLHTATIVRSDYNLTIANVINASPRECTFLPCDYDLDEYGYIDRENNWEKGGGVLSTTRTHFGNGSFYLNLPAGSGKYGPNRDIVLSPNRDYVLSCWAYVEDGSLLIGGHYGEITIGGLKPSLHPDRTRNFSVEGFEVTPNDAWQHVELVIPASRDLQDIPENDFRWGAHIYIGAPNGVKAYVDGVRFHPTDAHMTTSYYDMKWRKVHLQVDVNNNPSRLTVYDEYGRTDEIYKVDKSKNVTSLESCRLMSKSEYGFAGDHLRVLTPNGGEVLQAGENFPVIWNPGKKTEKVNVLLFDGNSWSSLANNVGGNSKVVSIAGDKTGCKIKVVDNANDGKFDESDESFSVVVNSAPLASKIVAPTMKEEVASENKTVTFSWESSTDPDGETVTYTVDVAVGLEGDWNTIEQDLVGTEYSHQLPAWGIYRWRVRTTDGKDFTPSAEIKFYSVPEYFFVLRDIDGKMVPSVPADLANTIRTTLSSEKKEEFFRTYNNTEMRDGYRTAEILGYFQAELDDGSDFYYSINHSKKSNDVWDAWLDAVNEGEGVGYTGLRGGDGCGPRDGEMRCIQIKLHKHITDAPAMTFSYKWACPNDGQKSYSWGPCDWTKNQENAIINIKWKANEANFHTWYRAHHRDKGTSGWKTQGQWTDEHTTINKVDKIWLRMYQYDKN